MQATYNITNDKLFAKFDDRLSPEDYKAARHAGFVWWPGSKQFVAKWSTQAEDFLLGMGISEIAEDDAPDNVEARVNRFDKYASEAGQSAESAETYLNERANTERRRKNAVNAIEKNLSAAEHWQERIESAIRHAAFKERPDVIARRIEGIEKQERKFKKELDRKQWHCPSSCYNDEAYRKYSSRKAELEAQLNADKRAGNPWSDAKKAEAIAELRPLKAAIFYEDKLAAAWKAHCDWAQRWLDHVQKRLQYERACLEAVGGIVGGTGSAPMDHEKFQVAGAIQTRNGEWLTITKVNKRTVEVFCRSFSSFHYRKIDRTEITGVLSPEEAKAQEPQLEQQRKAHVAMMDLAHKQAAKLESEHMAELDEMSRPRKYSELGRYDKEQVRERLAQSLQSEKEAVC